MMFDAAYFRDRFPRDVREKSQGPRGHEPSVRIHLHGGATHTVARTVEVGPGWVVFDTYRKKKDEPPQVLDRVTFAYNAISHISIVVKPVRGVGFRLDDVSRSPAN